MINYVLDFSETDRTMVTLAGGKGANLGELSRIEALNVPNGFCITTEAFKRIIEETPALKELLDQLSLLKVNERDSIREISGKIRRIIEEAIIPRDIIENIISHLSKFDDKDAFAVRSSATAEDLPTASFAGQQDTYLNVIGKDNILEHISKCWASLFTERAIVYRIQHGFDHRKVRLAVVIQQMIFPQASGILFTADPVTANRKISSVDAGFGLGEALVSGLVNADHYKIREGEIIDKKISTKTLAIHALQEGGTKEYMPDPEKQNSQVLTDEQILQLAQTGRKIEAHFGRPQDIEWCLFDGVFYIVQSRPVTTLYPIPEMNDSGNHVYLSFGHQQMMTDAMKPLGYSMWQLTAARPMYEAGGRLFVDVAPDLASPAKRAVLINVLGKYDPLFKDALTTIIDRDNFIVLSSDDSSGKTRPLADFQALNDYDPTLVAHLIERYQASIKELKQNIRYKSGSELIGFMLNDIQWLKQYIADPQGFGAIMTTMNAATWINEHMQEWLGEKALADTLAQSVPNNVTSEMGLALLDVADVIRPYPEVIHYMQQMKEDSFPERLVTLNGGQETIDTINNFLSKYGMRCAGEIDITKPRWTEKPATLFPMILGNIKNFEPGAGKRKFDQGLQEASNKEQELLQRLRQLPDGAQKADETRRMIEVMRNYAGYREYPKYAIVSRYLIYKRALLKEADRLVQANVIQNKDDIYYLTVEELHEMIRTNESNDHIISQRKEEHKIYEKLSPPRVMTSDGEIITGAYRRENLPAGVIVGLAVSSGVIEGRARVILHMDDADLEAGDILVTKFTDPSWTPLFVSVKGLVTEVGGLMTHGAVIAREYGLPAIVGVDNATKRIKDGQRIRLNGTDGYVEIL